MARERLRFPGLLKDIVRWVRKASTLKSVVYYIKRGAGGGTEKKERSGTVAGVTQGLSWKEPLFFFLPP